MCLLLYKNQEPELLKEDMTVYKIVGIYGGFGLGFVSEIRYFRYIAGVLYETDMTVNIPGTEFHGNCWNYSIYENSDNLVKRINNIFPDWRGLTDEDIKSIGKDFSFKSVSTGFHSFSEPVKIAEEKSSSIFLHLVECTIPKGSLIYRVDYCNQVVSNKIIINKVCA